MMMVAIADRALIVTLNAEHLGYRTQIFSAFCSGKIADLSLSVALYHAR